MSRSENGDEKLMDMRTLIKQLKKIGVVFANGLSVVNK